MLNILILSYSRVRFICHFQYPTQIYRATKRKSAMDHTRPTIHLDKLWTRLRRHAHLESKENLIALESSSWSESLEIPSSLGFTRTARHANGTESKRTEANRRETKRDKGKTEERERTIVQRTPQRGQKLVNKERELARSGRLESRSRSSLACSLPGTSPRRRRRLGRRLAGVRVVWKIQRNSESIWSRSSWPGTEAIRSQEEARAGEWGWSADNEEGTTMVRVGDCRER